MIKELKFRLTILYTLTTGIILTLVVIALSIITQMNLSNEMETTFQNHVMNISTKIQTDTYFNISWIAAMEADNNLIIHIEENGKPLFFRSAWTQPTDRELLLEQARAQAKKLHTDISIRPVSSASISPVFTLKGNKKDQYKGIALSYPAENGYKSMILLYYISPFLNKLQSLRMLFIVADLLGIAALYLVSRRFVKNAVKPVEVSNQKQQEFVAAASHELRSPLMVIQSSAQAIESAPDKTAQFTQNIKKECKRMSHLIQDMLTLASIDSGNWTFAPETLDINTILIDFYERYEPVCLEKNISLHLKLPDNMLPPLSGDGERLLQILTILMNNAISYDTGSDPIQLEAAQWKSHIYIKVIDHGTGIDDDKKELIFDRFYRADKSRKDKQHFGLGLSVARELASLHKGSLSVKDTPGGGSTFILKLPCIPAI